MHFVKPKKGISVNYRPSKHIEKNKLSSKNLCGIKRTLNGPCR